MFEPAPPLETNQPTRRPHGDPPAQPRLVRAVGLTGLTAISLNGVIGSGIFVLPATVAGLLGAAGPLAFVIAGVATALIVLCFAEAGGMFEETGGPYIYAREAFGAFVSFEVGWMFLLTRIAATAAITHAFTDYLGYFLPACAAGTGRFLSITVLIALLAWLNLVGIRWGARAVNLLTAAKMLPILLFIGVGLFFIDPGPYRSLSFSSLANLRGASLSLVFAFGGFENASVPSEEVKSPTRNLPIALLISISLTIVIYVLIQVVAFSVLPGLAGDPTPLASAGKAFLGSIGATLITIGAILSTSGSTSAVMLVGPRILYALSVGKQLPRALSRVHPRFHTPHVSVMVFALLVWILALYGNFVWLVAISAMARLLFSTATCLALPVLRKKVPTEHRRFQLPGGNLIPVVACIVSLWLLSGIKEGQALAGLVALSIGAVFNFFYSRAVPPKNPIPPQKTKPKSAAV